MRPAGAISCSFVSTGGEYRGVLRDRHFSAASSFPIGVLRRPVDGIKRKTGADLAAFAHHLQPAVTIVGDGCAGPPRAFHLFWP
jgi:hypothetical protein